MIKGIWTNVCRFVLAVVFIFSGFVKAVDPLGSYYKIQDYVNAFGIGDIIPSPFLVFGAVLLAALEFTLGVFFFFGIRRKFTTAVTLVFMIFMTTLTFYLAIANPVSDCGCFGDAIILTNWETFWKNVFLLIAAISVFIWGDRIVRMVSEKSQWLVVLYTVMFIFSISIYCLYYLPIFDFRPYRIGANIPEQMIIPEGARKSTFETTFILEKNGEQREFTLENYPDSTWTYIDRNIVQKEKGYEPPIHDFSILDINEGEDITEQVLTDEDYTFLLIAHRIENASDGNIDLINEIYDYSVENGYAFYCLTSSPEEDIEQWKDKTGAEYPFGHTEDIALKTIVRSNPGLVLIKGGTVINKWSHHDLPDEYVLNDRLENLEIGKLHPGNVLYKVLFIVLLFIVPLLIFKGLDILVMRQMVRNSRRKRQNKEDL